jgi:hypothetical protein
LKLKGKTNEFSEEKTKQKWQAFHKDESAVFELQLKVMGGA